MDWTFEAKFVTCIVNQMKDVDKLLHGNHKLIFSQIGFLTRQFYEFLWKLLVPFVSYERLYTHEDVLVLLIVACYNVGGTVGNQAIKTYFWTVFCFANKNEILFICWAESPYYALQVLETRVEDSPIRKGKSLNK